MSDNDPIVLHIQELIKLIELQNRMIGHIGIILNFFATVLLVYILYIVVRLFI